MKIFTRFTNTAMIVLSIALFVSCGGKEETPAAKSNTKSESMMKIRYIDADSLAKNYNLAKDLQEAYLRSYDNYQSVVKQKSAEIQKMQNTIANKQQNNGYLSQASYEADMQKYQKMNADAQNQVAALERSISEEQSQNMSQINDSIDNYLKKLCKDKGYEVVLNKNTSTFYIDAKYDITDEVVKGLNARYVKVKK